MSVYFADLRVAAPSAAEQASRADVIIYESDNGHTTVTSQVSGFPASQDTRERPSGRFLSDWLSPFGSLVTGIPAETMARVTNPFTARCLAVFHGAVLQTKSCSLCRSTKDPNYYYSMQIMCRVLCYWLHIFIHKITLHWWKTRFNINIYKKTGRAMLSCTLSPVAWKYLPAAVVSYCINFK